MKKLPPTTNVPWRPDAILRSMELARNTQPELLADYLKMLVIHIDAMYGDIANIVNKNAEDVWDDLRVSLHTGQVPAANYPSWSLVKDNGSGSTGVRAYHFSDGEYLWLTTQMPHGYKEGTTIYPHIHFMTTTNVSPTQNFGIGMEYSWTNTGDVITTTTLTPTLDIPTGVNSSYKHQKANVITAGISWTGKTISSMFMVRLFRAAASASNYAADVIITDFDIHFQKDHHGSANILTK